MIIEELISRGVRDVVLAPTRSAPLAYECFEADRIGLLRLHVRVDGGHGWVSRPRACQGSRCASCGADHIPGTATANLPAVLEAWHARAADCRSTAQPAALGDAQHRRQSSTDQDQLSVDMCGFATLSDKFLVHRTGFEMARIVTVATGSRTRMPGPGTAECRVQRTVDVAESAWPPPAPALVITPSDALAEPMKLSRGIQMTDRRRRLPPDTGAGINRLATEAANLPLFARSRRATRAAVKRHCPLIGCCSPRRLPRRSSALWSPAGRPCPDRCSRAALSRRR